MKITKLKKNSQYGMAILSMCFLLNIQHIQGQDDQAADSSPDAVQVEASAVPAAKPADDQAVASKGLTAEELTAKFANEIADLRKVLDQLDSIRPQIDERNSMLEAQIQTQFEKDHPEVISAHQNVWMAMDADVDSVNAIMDLKMHDPQLVEWNKQSDALMSQRASMIDHLTSEASAAGSACTVDENSGGFTCDLLFLGG